MIGLDPASLLAPAILVLLLVLMLLYAVLGRRWPAVFRPLRGFEALGIAIERAVEDGERVHLSLGTGPVHGTESAAAFAGLSVLGRVAAATAMSDRPGLATAGDGAVAVLAQDTLSSAYVRAGAGDRYRATLGRMLGPTPFAYLAALPTMLATEGVSVHMLLGAFGVEAALAADFGERHHAFVLAGTDDVQTQALLFPTAEHALVGEEVFAGGAYLNVGPLHQASLRAQDALRMLLVLLIVLGTAYQTLRGFL